VAISDALPLEVARSPL